MQGVQRGAVQRVEQVLASAVLVRARTTRAAVPQPTSRFWLIRGLWRSRRATQDIDSPLERVHARAHLTSLNVSSDEVADGGSYRDACRTSGKADQRAGECKYSRKHWVSLRDSRD